MGAQRGVLCQALRPLPRSRCQAASVHTHTHTHARTHTHAHNCSALLSSDARVALGLDPEGSVVVFDEAHNLLDAINGAHSSSITGAARALRGAVSKY